MKNSSHSQISVKTRLKAAVFQSLVALLEWRQGKTAPYRDTESHPEYLPAKSKDGTNAWLWVFVSTIGELNAIEPYLRKIVTESDGVGLLLLTDHSCYRKPYLEKYPDSVVWVLTEFSDEAEVLYRSFPPKLFIIAEIPCILWDAPCRFSYLIPYALARRNIPICIVNGWVYRDGPACRMDALERRWFGLSYFDLIDLFMVQTDEIRDQLIDSGVQSKKITITGNIKFDSFAMQSWDPAMARDPEFLSSVENCQRPRIVAGCVSEIHEQKFVLDAFLRIKEKSPNNLFVFAPRHPEKKRRMEKLKSFLEERGLRFGLRSMLPARDLDKIDVLVLDTYGELRDFYAVATITYVGNDHNLLEPLAYGKPIFLSPGWEPKFPSYPIYKLLHERGLIKECDNSDALAAACISALNTGVTDGGSAKAQIADEVANLVGATKKSLEAMTSSGLLSLLRGHH